MNVAEKLKALTKLAGVSLLAVATTAPFYGCSTFGSDKNMVRILQPRPGVPMPYQDPTGPPPRELDGTTSTSTNTNYQVHTTRPNTYTSAPAPTIQPIQRPTVQAPVRTTPPIIVDPGSPTAAPTVTVPPPSVEAAPVITPPTVTIKDPPIRTVAPPPVKVEDPLPTVNVVPLTYKVVKGDSWWKIGRAYGISMNELIAFNNADKNKPLRIGQVVSLPPGAKFIPKADRPPIKTTKTTRTTTPKATTSTNTGNSALTQKFSGEEPVPADGKYTVEKGDSLWKIAKRFGLSIKQIMDLNNLKDSNLFPNQTLILRNGGASSSSSTTSPTLPPAVIPTETDSIDPPPTRKTDAEILAELDTTAPEPATDATTTTKKIVEVASMKKLPHFVDEKDTLAGIAEMYGSKVAWIKQVNPEINSDADLTKGKEIDVPIEDVD